MKNMTKWYQQHSESGSSLLEVIVAVVILAVVGSTLLGGLNSANLSQKKTAQVAFAENAMQMGNDSLALTSFTACDSTTQNPYAGLSLPANVTVISVSVVDPTTNAITPCSGITTAAAKTAETVEQIKLQYINAVTGVNRVRYVQKYLQTLTTNLSTDCKAVGYRVNPISPSTTTVIAGDSGSFSTPMSTTCDGLGTDTVFSASGATGVTAVVDAKNYLNFSTLPTTTVGNSTVRVDAKDALTGTAAINATATLVVAPTLSLASGSSCTSKYVALISYGMVGTGTNGSCGSVTSVKFTLTGGVRNTAVTSSWRTSSTWQSNTASAALPFDLTVVNNVATLTYNNAVASANSYTLALIGTGGALNNPMSVGSINLVVRDQLSFGAFTPTCSGNYLANSSNSNCKFSLTSLPGTGYPASSGSMNFISNTANANFASDTSIPLNYNSTIDWQTGATQVQFGNKSTSALCSAYRGSGTTYKTGYTAGSASDSISLGYVTETLNGVTRNIPIIATVKC
jgi:Tfp pilus assembly protein PilV